MWITGFDVKSLSTVYLDKPMRGHTLMQTIARANRIFKGKPNGLIVDYIGVFRNLQSALSIYGEGADGELPVRNKSEMITELRDVVSEFADFVDQTSGVSLTDVEPTSGFERVAFLERIVDGIIASEDSRSEFNDIAEHYTKLFKGILPDPSASEFLPNYQLIQAIRGQIASIRGEASIDEVSDKIEDLLDESIEAGSYTIHELKPDEVVDLSQVDFEKLREKFNSKSPHIAVEQVKCAVEKKLRKMLILNKTRVALADRFQQMIDEYNAGSKNLEEFFRELMDFANELDEEEQRAVREEMSEEELVIFDLILRPGPELNSDEVMQVKKVARELLLSLKAQKLVLDWKKSQQNRAIVQRTIRDILGEQLPDEYDEDWQKEKLSALYEHFYESYEGSGVSVYAEANA